MRHQILLRSVQRLLPRGEHLLEAAYMWTRHSLAYLYAVAAFGTVALGGLLTGIGLWPARVALGIAAASAVVSATTDYWVLAKSDRRMVLCRGSRFRHVATEVLRDVERSAIEPVGGTMLATDWSVEDVTYTVPKSSEKAIQTIALF